MSSHQSCRSIALIQARVGSRRLPGKVLMDLAGKTLLEQVVRRVQVSSCVEQVWVVTSRNQMNHPVLELGRRAGFPVFVSDAPEDDVLGRYVEALQRSEAEAVVRVTADNPLTDPYSMREMMAQYRADGAEYLHNDHPEGLPSGFCSEVISAAALLRCQQRSSSPHHREHVTTYISEHPEEFRVALWQAPPHLRRREIRLTVDTAEDLDRMRRIFQILGEGAEAASPEEVLALFDAQGNLRG